MSALRRRADELTEWIRRGGDDGEKVTPLKIERRAVETELYEVESSLEQLVDDGYGTIEVKLRRAVSRIQLQLSLSDPEYRRRRCALARRVYAALKGIEESSVLMQQQRLKRNRMRPVRVVSVDLDRLLASSRATCHRKAGSLG